MLAMLKNSVSLAPDTNGLKSIGQSGEVRHLHSEFYPQTGDLGLGFGGAVSDKNGMLLLSDATETSADCGTNQMQNLLQMGCGTI